MNEEVVTLKKHIVNIGVWRIGTLPDSRPCVYGDETNYLV